MNIRLAVENEARIIAEIHKSEISKGFLSSLPLDFLTKLYKEIIRSESSFCIVTEQDSDIVGFVSGTTSLNAFYKYFLSHSFFSAALILLPKLLSFKKILESLFYPTREKNLPQAELLTIAVKKSFQGQGIASELLQRFIAEMKNKGVGQFKVLVGKELDAANRFYEKNGFKYFSDVSIHGNEKSSIYIYSIK